VAQALVTAAECAILENGTQVGQHASASRPANCASVVWRPL